MNRELETQSTTNGTNAGKLVLDALINAKTILPAGILTDEYKNFFQQLRLPWLNDLLMKLSTTAGKQSFLVFKNNKYFNIATAPCLPSSTASTTSLPPLTASPPAKTPLMLVEQFSFMEIFPFLLSSLFFLINF